ncbi:MAG: PKD domain-containing protein [Bacteroidia bacterium]|nr:PKD domain-containing protein [Bacteroidia bacterium]
MRGFIMLALCTLVFSCKKRKYPDAQVQLEKEDIYVNAIVDGEAVNLKIGAEDYYCYSSYSHSADSIYQFKGELRKYDCNPCPLSLMVELTDYQKSLPGSVVQAENSLRKGSRIFLAALAKTYTVKFRAHSNKNISSLRWNLNNGTSSSDSVFSFDFGQPGAQTVSLTIKTDGGCETVVQNKIYVSESSVFACNIEPEPGPNNQSGFRASLIGGKAPFYYTWYFGDGYTSNNAEPTHIYQYPGSYPVKVRIEDADGHICESNSINVVGNDLSSCSSNMSVSHAGTRNLLFNGVKIQWTDRTNFVLRSDSIDQPPGSYFEIVDSQEYEKNEKGESGRLLTVRFNVLLQ